MVASLEDGVGKPLMPAESNAVYASGHLLFVKQETLMARRFDSRRLRFAGEAFPIAENVLHFRAAALGVFSASENGVLVYHTGGLNLAELAWMTCRQTDRDHWRSCRVRLEPGSLRTETRLPSRSRTPGREPTTSGLSRSNAASGPGSRSNPRRRNPLSGRPMDRRSFTPRLGKGTSTSTGAPRGFGRDELLLQSQHDKYPSDWHPDGHLILYETEGNIWVLPSPETGGRTLSCRHDSRRPTRFSRRMGNGSSIGPMNRGSLRSTGPLPGSRQEVAGLQRRQCACRVAAKGRSDLVRYR